MRRRALLLSLLCLAVSGCGEDEPRERPATPPEPQFNGGFDTRDMGQCYPSADGTLCDWPVSLPTGWELQAPNVWNHGIHAQYANGRTPSPPHPHHPSLSSNSALFTGVCDPGVQGPNGGDCTNPYVLRSSRFTASAGVRYRLTAWFRSDIWYPDGATHENAAGVRVRWLSSKGAVLRIDGFSFSPAAVPVRTWTENSAMYEAPEGTARAQVEVTAEKRKRFLYVDDVRLVPE